MECEISLTPRQLEFYDVKQAAKIWQVSEEDVRNMKRAGMFPVFQESKGSKILIPLAVVIRIAAEKKKGYRIA